MGIRGSAGTYRTILISDLHLGSYRCDAASVLGFLETHTADALYLVGDIVDFWSLRGHAGWQGDHLAVVRRLVEQARAGTRIILVPGNHDGPLLHMAALGIPGIEIVADTVLHGANGGRFLVAHGHEQDALFGTTHATTALLYGVGEKLGLWSRLQRRDAELLQRPGRFEVALAHRARAMGLDGVICGHSHRPADLDIDGVRYLNCGDWLTNCTAVVETFSGQIGVLSWAKAPREAEVELDWGVEGVVPALGS